MAFRVRKLFWTFEKQAPNILKSVTLRTEMRKLLVNMDTLQIKNYLDSF